MKQDIFYQKIEADAFFERHKKNHKTLHDQINKNFLRKTKKEIYDILRKNIKINKNFKVLEVGCYIADLLYQINKKHKCKVYGIEPSKHACKLAKNIYSLKIENKTFFNSKFFKLKKNNHQVFDIIIFDDVLSWIDRDLILPTFGVIDWILKKNGHIFFRDFSPKKNFAHPNHHWKTKKIFNFKHKNGHMAFFLNSGKFKKIYHLEYSTNKFQKIKIKNKTSMIWSDTLIKKVSGFTHPIIKI